ncbi:MULTISPECIES: fluoride efflux transporter CrcB [unclassified Roseitalea]|uniref:fluoride efflux transporter CrcB n=1 Tax=unclassified Roseitalea TaxID=2639107 RepID=UPI00273F2040|nr:MULTISPECIES: fluoride efflux transporter CrcB [unclassified Roseitalea]
MINLVWVALGGAAGASLRYLVYLGMGRIAGGGYPWATMTVNVVGSLLMGVLVGWLMRRGGSGEHLRLLLGVGLLGGFTTFSSFSLDFALLWQRGDTGTALGYALVSVAACIAALFAGMVLVRGA